MTHPHHSSDDGYGVWELDDYRQLEEKIHTAVQTAPHEFDINELFVVGCYGAGCAVPNKTPLQFVITGQFEQPHIDIFSEGGLQEKTKLETHLEEHTNIHAEYDVVPEITILSDHPENCQDAIEIASAFHTVTTYYNLTADEQETLCD